MERKGGESGGGDSEAAHASEWPPYRVQYRGVRPSQAIEKEIRKKVLELWKRCPEIIFCRVVIESDREHLPKGNPFHVHVKVEVPGPDLMVNHHPLPQSPESLHAALQEAFDVMRRKVEDFTRLRRRKVKQHKPPRRGVVSAVFPEMNGGRIRSREGEELYFDRNSLKSGDFGKLIPGTPVQFGEAMGEQGLQAVFVKVSNPS